MNIFFSPTFLWKAYSRFDDKSAIILFILVVTFFIFLLLIKKWFFRAFKKKSFKIIPIMTIRNVSSIAMLIAMNIALIISVATLSHKMVGMFFSIYPGIRFLFENILVKIGGILFGPLIGIYIALTTDLLTVIFTSSVLHYGYLFSAIMNGFMGGIINLLIEYSKKKRLQGTIVTILVQISSLFLLAYLFMANSNEQGALEIKFLNFYLNIYWVWLFSYISFIFIVSIFFLILSNMYASVKRVGKYRNNFLVNKFTELSDFFIIFSTNFASFILIDVTALPLFDIKISSLPYEQFLIFRIITFLPMLFISSVIIWFIFKLKKNINIKNIEVYPKLKRIIPLLDKLKLRKRKKRMRRVRISLNKRISPLCIH